MVYVKSLEQIIQSYPNSQKHIRLKLNNGLLTNENEETDTEFHHIILRLASY